MFKRWSRFPIFCCFYTVQSTVSLTPDDHDLTRNDDNQSEGGEGAKTWYPGILVHAPIYSFIPHGLVGFDPAVNECKLIITYFNARPNWHPSKWVQMAMDQMSISLQSVGWLETKWMQWLWSQLGPRPVPGAQVLGLSSIKVYPSNNHRFSRWPSEQFPIATVTENGHGLPKMGAVRLKLQRGGWDFVTHQPLQTR